MGGIVAGVAIRTVQPWFSAQGLSRMTAMRRQRVGGGPPVRSRPRRQFSVASRLLIGCTVLVSACGKAATDAPPVAAAASFTEVDLPSFQLVGRVLPGSDSVFTGGPIAVLGSNVLVAEGKGPAPLAVLDRQTGRFVERVASFGAGPGEFGGISSMNASGSNDVLLYDFGSRRAYTLNTNQLQSPSGMWEQVHLVGGGAPLKPVLADGDSIVSNGLYADGRLAVYAPDGSLARHAGELPPGDEEVPGSIRNHAWQSFLYAHPQGSAFVLVNRHADMVEIYNRDLTPTKRVSGPLGFLPAFDIVAVDGAPVFVQDPDIRFGYTGVTATSDHIFALYSGRSMLEAPGRAFLGSSVIVFDWGGTPIAKLNFEGDALSIAVSESGEEVFLLFQSPAPVVVRYEVPDFGMLQ